jgi:hypothetical protein
MHKYKNIILNLFLNNLLNYPKLIKTLVSGHFERAEREFDKLVAPFSPILFNLYIIIKNLKLFDEKKNWNK